MEAAVDRIIKAIENSEKEPEILDSSEVSKIIESTFSSLEPSIMKLLV